MMMRLGRIYNNTKQSGIKALLFKCKKGLRRLFYIQDANCVMGLSGIDRLHQNVQTETKTKQFRRHVDREMRLMLLTKY